MMQDAKIVFEQYSYTALSETVYHPYFKNGNWYFEHSHAPYTMSQVVYLCRIPDDEAIMLKLQYGA